MSDQEFDRKMAFIVEQQAQFASDIQQLREAQTQTDEMVNRLANATFEGFKDLTAKINALVDSQIRTDENMQRTDERLRNLITVVDRYFSEGQNGH